MTGNFLCYFGGWSSITDIFHFSSCLLAMITHGIGYADLQRLLKLALSLALILNLLSGWYIILSPKTLYTFDGVYITSRFSVLLRPRRNNTCICWIIAEVKLYISSLTRQNRIFLAMSLGATYGLMRHKNFAVTTLKRITSRLCYYFLNILTICVSLPYCF